MGKTKSRSSRKTRRIRTTGRRKAVETFGLPSDNTLEDEPPPPTLSAYDSERFNRALTRILADKDFKTADEMNAFLEETFTNKSFDEITADLTDDPIEVAQDLVFQANEAQTMDEARDLYHRALALDPDNVEAKMGMALTTFDDPLALIARMREIIAEAETHFGEDFMRENKGHFWGVVETRPYMRVRHELVQFLLANDKREEAVKESEAMLELNPNDNQGVRDRLLGIYLELDDLEGARRLFDQYEQETFATFAWGRVLERFLARALGEAIAAYRRAWKTNRHVANYLTGRKELPDERPFSFQLGSSEEAFFCLESIGMAWLKHPEALDWLEEMRRGN